MSRTAGSAPIRVLLIEANEDGTVGGSHQVLYDMVRHFDRSQVEPILLFYERNRFSDMSERSGFAVICWDEVRRAERDIQLTRGPLAKLVALPANIRRRVALLREQRIDLVHMNNSPRSGRDDWLPAARLAGIPIVASARGDAAPLPGRGLRADVHRWLMTRFDRVLAVSEYIAASWRAQGVAADRVRVVHDGVDRQKLQTVGAKSAEQIRQELEIPSGRVFVAMVGNIRHWKGQHVVIEALGHLDADTRQRLCVAFIGAMRAEDQEYLESLKARADALGITDCIRFAGSRTDIPDVFSTADLMIHSSVIPEPGGTVVIEAMTFGTPVIVADKGGHLDYLQEGLGRVYDVERPQDLAQHLRELVDDPAQRRRMAEGARVRAADFSIERTSQKTELLYRELLHRA